MFNKMITRLLPVMPKKLVWIFSKKYIAGETLDDAIRVCRELNAMKIRFTLDLLGEFITRLDEEVCYRNIREIVAKAASYNNFIRIDMEDSQCTDKEITLFRRLKAEFPRHVGLVVQAYLHRSIVEKGHPMRVYVPFGKDWFGYSTRRLKENPKIASDIIKALIFKG